MDPIKTGEQAGKLLAKFIPPATSAGTEEEARKLWRWRLLLAVTVLVNIGLTIVHIAWACSLIPGLTGFALAEDVKDVQKANVDIAKLVIEQRIFDLKVRQCEAIEAKEPRIVLLSYAEKIADLKKEYFRITKEQVEVPDCAEI